MQSKRDYYKVLEVPRDADSDVLKKSYRRLAMKYHPDQNPDDKNAADKFKDLTEAYQVLSDSQQRARYDRFGHNAPDMAGFGGAAVNMGSMTDFFESIFGSVFGGQPRRQRRRGTPGRDLQYDLSLSLEQIYTGTDVKITIPKLVRCDECGGSGAAKRVTPQTCGQCQGRGQVQLRQGIFTMSTTCLACGGTGETISEPCAGCDGRGMMKGEEEYEVHIPAGADDGAVKIIEGGGEHGRGGAPNGDLHVIIRVAEHPVFRRQGYDLHGAIHVSYPQAVLGAQIEVPTIDAPVTMKINPGTENGRVYRLKGKGLPALRSGRRGDQHVHVEVAVPKKLTDRQRKLIEELGEELGEEVQSRQASFFEKMKNFFE